MAEGICGNCSVTYGLCPDCGTFWVPSPAGPPGSRYGITPVTTEQREAYEAAGAWPAFPAALQQLPNVIPVGTAWR